MLGLRRRLTGALAFLRHSAPALAIILAALGVASAWLLLLLWRQPTLELEDVCGGGQPCGMVEKPALYFPTSVQELQRLAVSLNVYRHQHLSYVLLLFCSAYIYKQTFAIPGSALMNVLAGALFGVGAATPLVCVLTAVGASCCYLLSSMSLAHLLARYQAARVDKLRRRLAGHTRPSLFLMLVSVRVFPGTPNWFLNMTAPVVGVPLSLFAPSVLVGLAPYNAVCCLAGASVARMTSVAQLWSWQTLGTLLVMAVATLVTSRLVARWKPADSDSSLAEPSARS